MVAGDGSPRERFGFFLPRHEPERLPENAHGTLFPSRQPELSEITAGRRRLRFDAGSLALSSNALGQTLVQVGAPASIRGRVIGLYAMSALGMRTFSGVTVGLGGAVLGIHWSLALSAGVLLVLTLVLFFRAGFASPPRA
jgi:hypothetical protein